MRVAVEHWRDGLGFAGLLLAAAFGWFGPASLYLGLVLALIAFAADWRAWRGVLREPVFLVLLACLGWLALRWSITRAEHGIPAADQLAGLTRWGMLALFPLVAWWLRGDPARLRLVWLVALTGMLIGLLGSLDPDLLQQVAKGSRYGFHLKKPVALALYVATLALGLLLLAPHCWGRQPGPWRWLRIGLWGAALLLLGFAFLGAQSRGPLVALLLVWPPILLLRYGRHLRHWRGWLVLALAGGVLLVAVSDQIDGLRQRLASEPQALTALLQGEFRDAPATSLGFRLRLWEFGLDKWRERPWIGWGPGATKTLTAAAGDPALNNEVGVPFDHLHNSYLELLLGFGVIGATLGALMLTLLVRALWRDWRRGAIPSDHGLWLLGSLAFTGIWCLTDFRALHYDWRFFWLLLAGSAYSVTMRRAATG